MVEPLPDEPTALLPSGGHIDQPAVPSRRWRRWPLIAVAAALTVALLAGTAWAVLRWSAPSQQAAGPAASPSVSAHSVRPGGHRIRGTIVTETGPTWTVRATNGRTVTVVITAQTVFGTAKHPASAADFPVGTAVAVTGTVDHATVTATRVAAMAAPAPSATA